MNEEKLIARKSTMKKAIEALERDKNVPKLDIDCNPDLLSDMRLPPCEVAYWRKRDVECLATIQRVMAKKI